jgi:hypothetical protein
MDESGQHDLSPMMRGTGDDYEEYHGNGTLPTWSSHEGRYPDRRKEQGIQIADRALQGLQARGRMFDPSAFASRGDEWL